MAGAPPGFQAALNRKYDIQQQEADAHTGLAKAQADAIPLNTQSENQLRSAQAFQTQQQGEQVASLAQSQRDEALQRGLYYGQQAGLAGTQNKLQGLGLQPFTDQAADGLSALDNYHTGTADATVSHEHAMAIYHAHPVVQACMGAANVPHMKKGMANVRGKMPAAPGKAGGGLQAALGALQGAGGAGGPGPQVPMPGSPMAAPMGAPPIGMFGGGTVPGKGSGKVDTVPAVLAPHEAVLNRAAADKLGRGKIAALNQKGAQQMGTAPKPGSLPTKKPPLRKGMV